MYEGKNIHYSLVDQKPLCSFSGKVCNQRRLNKYGFCVRHILEDPFAPFKRCAYVAKSSRQTCTQPIPKNEEREYCNNHMQVLGMLPKKERKTKKEKDRLPAASMPVSQTGHSTNSDSQHSQIKRRLTVGGFKPKLASNKNLSSSDDVDDVYAFPADNNEKNSHRITSVSTITSIPVHDSSQSNSTNVQFSTFRSKSPSEGSGGHSSLAKIYPELAEKLEKIKPRVETKVKGKVKSSRTMNSLQTKIAQNKIKDKLKRNQGSSNASSQSQSPSHSLSNASSPGYHTGTSSPSVVVSLASPSIPQARSLASVPASQEGLAAVTSVHSKELTNSPKTEMPASKPSLSQLNLLNSINIHSLNLSLAQLGLPVPADIEQTLKQLLKDADIPLDGANLMSEGNQGTHHSLGLQGPSSVGRPSPPQDLTGILRPPFGQKPGPPPPYSSVYHKQCETSQHVSMASLSHVQSSLDSKTKTSNMMLPSEDLNTRIAKLTPPSVGRGVTNTCTVPIASTSSASLVVPVSVSPTPSLSAHLKHSLSTVSSLSSSPILSQSSSTSVATVSDLTRKMPMLQSQQKSKVTRTKPRSRNPSVSNKRPVPVFTLPMTLVKPRKIRKLSEKSGPAKLRNKSAKSYCEGYDNKILYNHTLIISGFDSSDESDLSDCDMVSWQPEWFRASSDEEACDEDESDYDLRTTKLALTRAQLRRQCFQGRGAYRTNTSLCRKNLESTSTLINLARESQISAVKCLNHIMDRPRHKKDKHKMRGLLKRRCLYKNSEEVQCTSFVVPYTNHCIKHVMYNVDQQLFEYCTAKFADNTQCCHPVIDVKHELPLCIEHGLKADNFLKTQDAEPKPKRPRKKTKPSALTRPPKKGKKKKNQRKSVRPQKPLPPEEPSSHTVSENDEDVNSGTQDEAEDANEDTNKESTPSKEQIFTKMAALKSAPSVPKLVMSHPRRAVNSQLKQEDKQTKSGLSSGQLEELENLSALTELDNVKMFGDLPLETASKLLEENDFQEVLNRLPDEAFDLFTNKGSTLPSNEELEELEKSLAMANRELTKDAFEQYTIPGSDAAPLPQQQHPRPAQQQQQPSLPPILDEADELTRQIAEEILNQNIGQDLSISNSMCNGDAQESIKAIARSLSNSGMMLISEANQRSQGQELVPQNQSLSRSQSFQSYGNLGKVQNPPNVMIQNVQQLHSQSSSPVQLQNTPSTVSLSQGHISQSQVTLPAQGQIPRNVTLTPQGIFQAQLPTASSMYTPVTANVQPSSAAFTGHQLLQGPQNSGIISLSGAQQLTSQQFTQLVQQATLQLPPLPPYTPPTHQTVATSAQPVSSVQVSSATASITKPLTQEQLAQQQHHLQKQQQELARQQEQLTQQQQLLTQQLLQQQLAALARQSHLAQTGKAGPSIQPSVNISALLQPNQLSQMGKVNQHLAQTLSNISQIPQQGKPSSQSTIVAKSSNPSSNLPSTNIIWTAPPNVTITTPNGIPRNLAQPTVTSSKQGSNTVNKVSLKDAFIDLTETSDPPPYTATQQGMGLTRNQPLTSLGTQTLTTTAVTGKS